MLRPSNQLGREQRRNVLASLDGQLHAQGSCRAPINRLGTFLYDELVTCDVRIVYSSTRRGSGDLVEPPEEDEHRDSYYLQYGGTEHRGVFIGGSGCFDILKMRCGTRLGHFRI